MKYVPREPRDGINVSKTHPLVEAGTLAAGLSLIFVLIVLVLVFMVELALLLVSPEAEARVFQDWTPGDLVAVDADDQRLAGVDTLTRRLARHWPESPYRFRVAIDDSELPNAMAFPGGLIIVTTGLLNRVESENELAFVLGHEIGHFRNRDHLRMLGRGVLLGLSVSVLGQGSGSGLGLTIADFTLRGFSRQQEADADEFGLALVYAEYGHVGEASRFFERISEEYGGDHGFYEYAATHPSPEDRINEIRELGRQRGWTDSGELAPLEW